MSVLINMEMPKEGFVEILIRDDGTVQQTGQSYRIDGTNYYTPYIGEIPVMYEAIHVPPHGRLIDADELLEKQKADAEIFMGSTNYGDKVRYDEAMNAVANIVNAPTVIPADKDGGT